MQDKMQIKERIITPRYVEICLTKVKPIMTLVATVSLESVRATMLWHYYLDLWNKKFVSFLPPRNVTSKSQRMKEQLVLWQTDNFLLTFLTLRSLHKCRLTFSKCLPHNMTNFSPSHFPSNDKDNLNSVILVHSYKSKNPALHSLDRKDCDLRIFRKVVSCVSGLDGIEKKLRRHMWHVPTQQKNVQGWCLAFDVSPYTALFTSVSE